MEWFTYIGIVLQLCVFIAAGSALKELRNSKQRMLAKQANNSEKQI
jgi:hypothetical protein